MLKQILLFCFALSCMIGNSQNDNQTEKIIRDLEKMAVRGVLEADTNILKKLWSTEFIVNTPRNTVAEGRDAVFANIWAGLINYSSFERNIEKIHIEGKTVITMGHETYASKTDLAEGKAGEIIKRRFTNVWMKQKGKWLLIARHASIICPE